MGTVGTHSLTLDMFLEGVARTESAKYALQLRLSNNRTGR